MNETNSSFSEAIRSHTNNLRKRFEQVFFPSKSEVIGARSFDGLKLDSGEIVFDSPDIAEIKKIQEDDRRVTYFRFRVPKLPYAELEEQRLFPYPLKVAPQSSMTLDFPRAYLVGTDHTFNRLGASENLFVEFVIHPLESYLFDKYADRDIGVRGTTTVVSSLPIESSDHSYLTPNEILAAGVESGSDKVRMTPLRKVGEDKVEISHRSVQWLLSHPKGIRRLLEDAGQESIAKNIFPALIIYDGNMFSKGDMKLPDDPIERSKCIIEIIVFDMPAQFIP